ncbi:MAG TPA: SDR family oxidoreductase [Anaerolineae bacterium]|nr:SDR family oxidoreductase [Anaerolineae bacterium]
MRLVIFGASGRTGRHLIMQALEQGHTVTAFARTPGKIQTNHARLHIVQGNVLDAMAVEKAVAGHDAVLCALGVNRDDPTTALAEGTRHILQAMEKHGVRRMVCVSAAGFLGEQADFLIGKILFWYFGRFLTRLFDAMKRQYQELEKSAVDWIAVRPLLLDEGPRRGNYRIAVVGIPSRGYRINTGDVAEFMLQQLTNGEYVRKAPAIAY